MLNENEMKHRKEMKEAQAQWEGAQPTGNQEQLNKAMEAWRKQHVDAAAWIEQVLLPELQKWRKQQEEHAQVYVLKHTNECFMAITDDIVDFILSRKDEWRGK